MADSRFKEAFSMTLSTMLTTMGAGMLRTCAIFFLTLLGALPLGFVIYFARKSKIKVLSSFTKIYISIMRGTPLMLQLLVWYFGPYYLFRWSIRGYRFTAIILGFVLNYAAYFAEIYRGGIESMPAGQYEAAEVLASVGNERSDNAGKRYFSCFYSGLPGSFLSCKADLSLSDKFYAFSYRRHFLLYSQLRRSFCDGAL